MGYNWFSSGGNYPDSKHIGTTVRYNGAEIEIVSVQSSTSATGDILDELIVHLDVAPFRTTEGSADIEVTMVNRRFRCWRLNSYKPRRYSRWHSKQSDKWN